MLSVEEQARIWPRFFSKIDRSGTCWLWTGAKNNKGYGAFGAGGRWHGAHRLCWFLLYGEDPKRLHVLHKCDNPSCVNPSHLFLGTRSDNMQDCLHKQRSGNVPGRRRARWFGFKLTEEQIVEILETKPERGFKARLSRHLGVTHGAIRQILKKNFLRSC